MSNKLSFGSFLSSKEIVIFLYQTLESNQHIECCTLSPSAQLRTLIV